MIDAMELAWPGVYWHDEDPDDMSTPWINGWFQLSDPQWVADRDLGWFLAAGFKVVDEQDDPNNVGAKEYKVQRNDLQNQQVLEDLTSEYINAYNDARHANDLRYDDIVVMWNDVIVKGHAHLDRAAEANNSFEVLYLNTLDSIQSQIDFYLDANRNAATDVFDTAAASLNAYAAKLTELGTGYDEFKTDIEAILTGQASSLSQFTSRTSALLSTLTDDYTTLSAAITALEGVADSNLTSHITAFEAHLDALETTLTSTRTQLLSLVDDATSAFETYETNLLSSISTISGELTSLDSTVNGLLDDLDTAIDSHHATYDTLVAYFKTDYDTHATTTRALLTDLGATELARINEAADNALARQTQLLADRGFYASAMISQIEARVERERTEAIAAHNDALAREKVEHEHRLYGELAAVRDRQVKGEQYTYALQEMALKYRATWAEGLYQQAVGLHKVTSELRQSLLSAEQQVIAQETAVRERLHEWASGNKKTLADGQDRIYRLRDSLSRWKAESDFKLNDLLRAIRALDLDIYFRDLSANLDVDRFEAGAREGIVDRLDKYILDYASGVERYAHATIRNGQFLTAVKSDTAKDAMRTRFAYTDGLVNANNAQQKLLQYQLDARNELCLGLFGFMERRTDSYPDLDKMGQIAMGLGDPGATQWVQP